MEIVFEKDTALLQKKAAEALSNALRRQTPILLLLAGGSTFSFLDFVEANTFSSSLTIGMGDERFSEDEKINNFGQLAKTEFYMEAQKAGVHFFDSRVQQGESFQRFGERFGQNIKKWLETNPDGNIVATFGIGEDGHTAGILPYPENPSLFREFFEKNEVSVAFDAKEKNQYPLRVTVTLPLIRTKIREALVYVASEKKRQALEKTLAKDGKLEETPARILKEIKNATLFSDILL